MTETSSARDLSAEIAEHLPYLRRYARALTGSQQSGDHYAAATLEALLEDQGVFQTGLTPKVALFKAFNRIWVSSGSPVQETGGTSSPEAKSLTSIRPPERAVIRSARFCAATPGPGRFLGHAVTIFHWRLSCAMAGLASAVAAAPTAPA